MKYYEYLGKTELDVAPLAAFLKETIVPLYEQEDYRESIRAARTPDKIKNGTPPVWLDQNWQPAPDQSARKSSHYWCLPLANDLFIVGSLSLTKQFPEVFGFSIQATWAKKLAPFLNKPQILLSNKSSSIHTDLDRKSAINTFLCNTDKSITEFYQGAELVDSFSYSEGDTYLLDTTQLHRINQQSVETRLVLSWGYNISFEAALNAIQSS